MRIRSRGEEGEGREMMEEGAVVGGHVEGGFFHE